jgi:choline dehydrogenase-like flavoprotein
MAEADCDHIVVGAGAGGGTLAARLAEAGRRVIMLEAGGDPRIANDPRLPDDYDVPAFHPFASENPAFRWDFFVRHDADEAQQARSAMSA